MDNLGKCLGIVQRSRVKGGVSAKDIGKKLGMHRTTVHRHLASLQLMGKVESQYGLWTVKKGEQTVAPLEKEIVIELPTPEKEWQRIAMIKMLAAEANEDNLPKVSNIYATLLESYMETRTIRIKGKNVDDVELGKIGDLILQANKNSSKVNLRKFIKNLKRQPSENS